MANVKLATTSLTFTTPVTQPVISTVHAGYLDAGRRRAASRMTTRRLVPGVTYVARRQVRRRAVSRDGVENMWKMLRPSDSVTIFQKVHINYVVANHRDQCK